MKNILFMTAVMLLASLFAPQTSQAASFSCPPSSVYGYEVHTSSSVYSRGQEVQFCIRDNTRTPMFIGPAEQPWVIMDKHERVVFKPLSISPTTQPDPTYSWYSTWDGRNLKGKIVGPGKYQVRFTVNGVISTAFFTIAPSGK